MEELKWQQKVEFLGFLKATKNSAFFYKITKTRYVKNSTKHLFTTDGASLDATSTIRQRPHFLPTTLRPIRLLECLPFSNSEEKIDRQ